MHIGRVFSLLVAFVLSAGTADACIGFQKSEFFPIEVGGTCEFVNAGFRDSGEGEPAVNHGSGIVTQLLRNNRGGCSSQQVLVVLDCSQERVVVIGGNGPPPETHVLDDGTIVVSAAIAGMSDKTLSHALKKFGDPISFSKDSDLDDIISLGEPLGLFTMYDDVRGHMLKFDNDTRGPFAVATTFTEQINDRT